jgi:hypothetical protein
MLRLILIQLFLFMLPFIGFGVFLWATAGFEAARAGYHGARLIWMITIGAGLMVIGFVALAAFGEQETGPYQPLRYEDGQLVPGRFRERDLPGD